MSKLRQLHPGDPEFTVVDGLMLSQRAGLEISGNCPDNYLRIIVECLKNGWLQPVATVYEHELVFNKLRV